MRLKTPFLHGLHKLLGGRKPLSALEKLLRLRRGADVLCSAQLTTLFGAFLPAAMLEHKSARGGRQP